MKELGRQGVMGNIDLGFEILHFVQNDNECERPGVIGVFPRRGVVLCVVVVVAGEGLRPLPYWLGVIFDVGDFSPLRGFEMTIYGVWEDGGVFLLVETLKVLKTFRVNNKTSTFHYILYLSTQTLQFILQVTPNIYQVFDNTYLPLFLFSFQ